MRSSKVAKRYAQGLLDFATDTQTVDAVFGEMKDLVTILNTSKDLNAFLVNPFVEAKKKLEISNEIFKSFSQSSRNFIGLVIKHGRESELHAIATQYINKVEDIKGVQRVHLTTAVELDAVVVENILKTTGIIDYAKGFDLSKDIKPEILGGYVLRVGDQQIDASVRSKLNRLRKDFQLN